MVSLLSYSPEIEERLRKGLGILVILISFLVPSQLIIEKTTISIVTYSSLLYLIRIVTPNSSLYGSASNWEISVFPMSLVFKVPLLIAVYLGYELIRSDTHQEINVLGVIGVSLLQILFMFSVLVIPRTTSVSQSLIPYAEVLLIIVSLLFLGWQGLMYEERYMLLQDKSKDST